MDQYYFVSIYCFRSLKREQDEIKIRREEQRDFLTFVKRNREREREKRDPSIILWQ